jgi:branched-chain amino acid transport system substrate-binding protein
MRFGGGDDAPTKVEFPGSADKSTVLVNKDAFDPEHPLEKGIEDGLNYRLYRVRGNFSTDYDLRDYPFDTQQLLIRFQNAQQRRELITYVIDRAGLKLAEDGATQDTQPYRDLQLWRFERLRYFVDSLGSPSTLGKPENFATPVRIEHAVFSTAIVMHRKFLVFIVKTLTPVLLLVMVVFSTLFFPPSLLKEQVTLPVTAILASAVLLIAVNNQLPDIGYTVAIEYIFYVFFSLCLLAIVSAFMGEKLRLAGKKHAVLVLNHSIKVVYVVAVFIMLLFYWWHYCR